MSNISHITIRGACVHNLRDLTLQIPRRRLVVVTGVSGSGKSSLVFDTLYAEGQRRYVESLSSYARQFLGRMVRPAVNGLDGLSPAVAIEQKVRSHQPRSTVGTLSEVYDYLKLWYARLGEVYSPTTGRAVTRHRVSDVRDYVLALPSDKRVYLTAPLGSLSGRGAKEMLSSLMRRGYTRVLQGETILDIETLITQKNPKIKDLSLLIDRWVLPIQDASAIERVSDSIQTAFAEGRGHCSVHVVGEDRRSFSDRFEEDGVVFEAPSPHLFSFNSPYGCCKRCEGFGTALGLSEDLIIPDPSLSVEAGAIAPWRSSLMVRWLKPLWNEEATHGAFPVATPYADLDDTYKQWLWNGRGSFAGIWAFFDHLAARKHKVQYRVLLARYQEKVRCPLCKGNRLRKEASYVRVGAYPITELVCWPIGRLRAYIEGFELPTATRKVALVLQEELVNRLRYLEEVGLSYLTLNRNSNTLSGGEFQRIKLATALGSPLVGALYLLDEPSIGLHARDIRRLVSVLIALRDRGNTVIVVEHEPLVMAAADQIIDIGPHAGSRGGQLVYQGPFSAIHKASKSETGRYLHADRLQARTQPPRPWKHALKAIQVTANNLKELDVVFPLEAMTVVTGVSGSGKSTLVGDVLYPAVARALGYRAPLPGKHKHIEGVHHLKDIQWVSQSPIGKSSRSNPVTYIKAYDKIRQLYARLPQARKLGYTPAHFSFNVPGGRCPLCEGEGETIVEMQFIANIRLPCESCEGRRFLDEVLEVRYRDKNIYEVLQLTVHESMDFFKEQSAICQALRPLVEVGLGYMTLGQSANSLSGGEAQRIKLAAYLKETAQRATKKATLFIFDEPTTGLHLSDIERLLAALQALVSAGHSVLIVEHNMEIIRQADWIIDLGPEGGENGGLVCFAGTAESLADQTDNHTAHALRKALHPHSVSCNPNENAL